MDKDALYAGAVCPVCKRKFNIIDRDGSCFMETVIEGQSVKLLCCKDCRELGRIDLKLSDLREMQIEMGEKWDF